MRLVYYAHSYRPHDAEVVKYFADLMQLEGLTVSLDPPSDKLNAAKPERHLRLNDGLVAVLTTREGGPSQYILFEISLGMRSKKPVLVFVEDDLPDDCIPSRVLQRRFSRRSLLRDIRTHRHALELFSGYVGASPPPAYQPGLMRRRCLIVGHGSAGESAGDAVALTVDALRYSTEVLSGLTSRQLFDSALYDSVLTASFALVILGPESHDSGFLLGLVTGFMIPSIILTMDPNYEYCIGVPREYQPRQVRGSDPSELQDVVQQEIAIFEEEYVDLEDTTKVAAYSKMLFETAGRPGYHPEGLRGLFVKELVMGSHYTNYGQAGAMGDHASATINNFQEAWKQAGANIDLTVLATELGELRKSLRAKADTPENDQAVAAVGEAEGEAKKGNGPAALEKLARAGKWALGIAEEIGVKLAVEALGKSLGVK
jgi:hypothetical protein